MAPPPAEQHSGTLPLYVLLALSVGVVIWFFWLGTIFARLWYYKGDLQGEFEQFDIKPAYLRERERREQQSLAQHRKNAKRATKFPIPDITVTVTEEEPEDTRRRRRQAEDRRISRLPAFVQDGTKAPVQIVDCIC